MNQFAVAAIVAQRSLGRADGRAQKRARGANIARRYEVAHR